MIHPQIIVVSGIAITAMAASILLKAFGKEKLEKVLSLAVSLGLITYVAKLTKIKAIEILNMFGGWPL